MNSNSQKEPESPMNQTVKIRPQPNQQELILTQQIQSPNAQYFNSQNQVYYLQQVQNNPFYYQNYPLSNSQAPFNQKIIANKNIPSSPQITSRSNIGNMNQINQNITAALHPQLFPYQNIQQIPSIQPTQPLTANIQLQPNQNIMNISNITNIPTPIQSLANFPAIPPFNNIHNLPNIPNLTPIFYSPFSLRPQEIQTIPQKVEQKSPQKPPQNPQRTEEEAEEESVDSNASQLSTEKGEENCGENEAKSAHFKVKIQNTRNTAFGLKEISRRVMEIIKSSGKTNYKTISEQIVKEIDNKNEKENNNIKRRIYDSLNVMKSMKLFKKDKKSKAIEWNYSQEEDPLGDIDNDKSLGLEESTNPKNLQFYEEKVRELRIKIEKKAAKKDILNKELQGLRYILERNKFLNKDFKEESKIYFPFIILETEKNLKEDLDIVLNSNKTKAHFGFDKAIGLYGDLEAMVKIGEMHYRENGLLSGISSDKDEINHSI